MAENKNIVIRLMADTASYEAAMTRAGSTAKTVASGMENTGRKSALITSGSLAYCSSTSSSVCTALQPTSSSALASLERVAIFSTS